MGAQTSKTVGIKYQVDYKQLTEAEKATQRYMATLKKLGQIRGEVAIMSSVVNRGYQEEVARLNQLNETTQTFSNATFKQLDAMQQQNQAIIGQLSAIERNTQARQKSVAVTQQATQAQKAQTAATKNSASAWIKNARTLTFWTIGAASMYRLVQKIRREIIENIQALLGETEEYQNMTRATQELKASFMALLGTKQAWIEAIEGITHRIEAWSEGLLQAKATIGALWAFWSDFLRDARRGALALAGILASIFSEDKEQSILYYAQQIEEIGDETTGFYSWAQSYLDAYNKTLEETRKTQEEWAGAIAETEEKSGELTDEQRRLHRYLEQVQRAEQRRVEETIELYIEYGRRLQDISRDTARAMEDVAIKGTRKHEDIERDYQRRLEDIDARAQEGREKAEEAYRRRLIQIEMRYREQLIRIEENFADAMYDAISKRDATAALRAIRTRTRETARARRQRDNDRYLARLDYESQLNDQRRALEQQRHEAEVARQRALDDLHRDMERERQDIITNQSRELQDLRRYFDRKQQDIDADYALSMQKAEAAYRLDEQQLAAHLETQIEQWRNYYNQLIALRSQVLGATTMGGMPQIPAMTGGGITGGGGGGGAMPMAEGGMRVFTQPSTIHVAERGMEAIYAQPLAPPGQISGNFSMQHSVSGQVQGMMVGLEGRLTSVVTRAVIQGFKEVLR